MIFKNILIKIIITISLFVTFSRIEATTQVIAPEVQPDTKVCWAACADMLLRFYGNPPNLHGIWLRGTNGANQTNELCDIPFGLLNVHDILATGNPTRNVSSTCHSGVVLWSDLPTTINDLKPIIAGLSDNQSGHVVLIKGFETNGTIYFNDPQTGTTRNMPYNTFTNNGVFYWQENLIPNQGSPVGQVPVAQASIHIASGPTTFTYPGSNAIYTSTFSCPPGQTCMPPYQWNWSLTFDHRDGTYTACIQNVNNTGSSTWNVPAFNLPTSGYHWNYNASGQITGMVKVSADGYSDSKIVTYAPQILMPGYVNFDNQSIFGSHPEVDAHYCTYVNNVIVNPGASIIFKSGTCCDISNLTVENSSNVTFQIDPSLE